MQKIRGLRNGILYIYYTTITLLPIVVVLVCAIFVVRVVLLHRSILVVNFEHIVTEKTKVMKVMEKTTEYPLNSSV